MVKKDWWASGYFWSHTSGLVKTKFVKQRWFVFISFSLSLSLSFFFSQSLGGYPSDMEGLTYSFACAGMFLFYHLA